MTDTLIDDDIMEVASTMNKSTSATSRRPMFIETEVRTDTVTTRRMASAAANRSVQDVLENTRSVNDGRPATSYTYAQSTAYAPVTRSGAYEIPAMARRNLHNNNQQADTGLLSLPAQIFSNIRSQLTDGYAAVRDRLAELTSNHQGSSAASSSRSATGGGARVSRTSSQSSTSSGRATGYNLRSRPVHSTPRDQDTDQPRKAGGKGRKDNQHQGEIDEEEEVDDGQDEDDDGERHHKRRRARQNENAVVHYVKKILHSPVDVFDAVWKKLKFVPWWLLLPLLVLLGLYTLPYLGCKPFEHFGIPRVNGMCRDVYHYANNFTRAAYDFTRRHTYERSIRNLKQFYRSARDMKGSICSSLEDVFYSIRGSLSGSMDGVKQRVSEVVESTTEGAKEYCDVGLQKMNKLIDELKHEREKYLGVRHTLKPDEEKEFEGMVRQIMDEYSADETGQADYAMEANGAKVVDTRCTEYTDEPRQNVVKFLGIPIVHMSKHPDIIIKPGRMPGQCFPFKGDHGSIVIRLAVPVVPTEFVLEHLSKSISIVGHINSAPHNFTVYALKDKHDKEGLVLGRFQYDAENGPALQRFKPQIAVLPLVEYVEIQVTSNWGNPNYTCLYRFRVHGDMQTVTPSAPPAA